MVELLLELELEFELEKTVGWNESSDFNEELDDFTLGALVLVVFDVDGWFFGVGGLAFDSGADDGDESAGVVLLWTVMLNVGAGGAAFCCGFACIICNGFA